MSELVVDGKKIKKMLIERDITGRELANRVGVHEATITAAITGRSWSHQLINKIANELGVNPLDLLAVDGQE